MLSEMLKKEERHKQQRRKQERAERRKLALTLLGAIDRIFSSMRINPEDSKLLADVRTLRCHLGT
jgi:hypothetical protein